MLTEQIFPSFSKISSGILTPTCPRAKFMLSEEFKENYLEDALNVLEISFSSQNLEFSKTSALFRLDKSILKTHNFWSSSFPSLSSNFSNILQAC